MADSFDPFVGVTSSSPSGVGGALCGSVRLLLFWTNSRLRRPLFPAQPSRPGVDRGGLAAVLQISRSVLVLDPIRSPRRLPSNLSGLPSCCRRKWRNPSRLREMAALWGMKWHTCVGAIYGGVSAGDG